MTIPSIASRGRPRAMTDVRLRVILAVLASILIGGAALGWILHGHRTSPGEQHTPEEKADIHQRFMQGVAMLHAREYEYAAAAFHRVLQVAPQMPEAHVNMGYALLGLERHAAARDFFESAIALRTNQLNAYYGLAVALEQLRDMGGAVGAMRTYVHLTKPNDPYLRKAQAALWEWEAALARERAAR